MNLRMRCALGLASLLLATVESGSVRAEYAYRYVANTPSVSVAVGGTFVLDVFLEETAGDGDEPRFSGAGGGLFSSAVALTFGDSAPARVLADSDIMPNSGAFSLTDDASLSADLGSARVAQEVDLFDPYVQGDTTGLGVSRILVGSFRFSGLSAGNFSITLGAFDPSMDLTVTSQGLALDPAIAEGRVIVNVIGMIVPEPSSLLLACTGTVAVALISRRRRRPR